MSTEEKPPEGGLVSSSPHELVPKSSSLVKRGLALADVVLGLPASTGTRQLLGHTEVLAIRCFKGNLEMPQVAFSPDGRCLLSTDGDMRLWDIASGQELLRFERVVETIHDAAFSPDGRYILSGGYGGDIRLWDVASGRALRHWGKRNSGHFLRVAFSPDGHSALSASGGEVCLWDIASGHELHRFVPPSSHHRVPWVAFSPDGPRAVSYSDENNTILWDVTKGSEILRLEGCIERMAFSPDGRRALTPSPFKFTSLRSDGSRGVGPYSEDNSLPLWEIATGCAIHRFEGHTDEIADVTFSSDGHQALSSSWRDGTVRLWDVDSGHELHCWSPPGGALHVVFSPDDRCVASVDYDVIWLWRLPE